MIKKKNKFSAKYTFFRVVYPIHSLFWLHQLEVNRVTIITKQAKENHHHDEKEMKFQSKYNQLQKIATTSS